MTSPDTPIDADHPLEQVLFEVKKVIVGQDVLLERMIVALLARGHLLVEGVPGLAKTMAIKTLADAIGGEFQRIQFTPDLVPADIIGTRIYNQKLGEFQVSLGPVFANLLLADEINRAPAKVQSAMLEVMQERQVTIGRETHRVPDPFLVMATQNPIESEGTYELPEAQVDRFMLKVLVDYPTPTEEFVIVERMIAATQGVQRVIDTGRLAELQAAAAAVYVDPALIEYAVRLTGATRDPSLVGAHDVASYITFGASPRASINMILAGRALAFVRGRTYVLPQDVRDIARDVLRHRLVLSFEALADNVTPDAVLTRVLDSLIMPDVALREGVGPSAGALPPWGRRRVDDPVTVSPEPVGATAEAVLRRLEWTVIRRLDGRSQGDFRTTLRGSGIDVRDVRDYEYGDDVRHIDWNVTARLDSPFVREHLEDRELTAWLLLDRSPSMGFGPVDRPKELVLTELATTIARLLTRGGNRVGAILYDHAVEASLPARSGRSQVLRLTRELLRPVRRPGPDGPPARGLRGRLRRRAPQPRSSPPSTTNLGELLTIAAGVLRRRSLVVLISDFIAEPGWERPLGLLGQRHEVLAIRLVDPREHELPDVGVIVVEDAETGEQLTVDTSDPEFRRRLRQAADDRREAVTAAVRRAGVDLHDVSTDDDLVDALVRLTVVRRARRRR